MHPQSSFRKSALVTACAASLLSFWAIADAVRDAFPPLSESKAIPTGTHAQLETWRSERDELGAAYMIKHQDFKDLTGEPAVQRTNLKGGATLKGQRVAAVGVTRVQAERHYAMLVEMKDGSDRGRGPGDRSNLQLNIVSTGLKFATLDPALIPWFDHGAWRAPHVEVRGFGGTPDQYAILLGSSEVSWEYLLIRCAPDQEARGNLRIDEVRHIVIDNPFAECEFFIPDLRYDADSKQWSGTAFSNEPRTFATIRFADDGRTFVHDATMIELRD